MIHESTDTVYGCVVFGDLLQVPKKVGTLAERLQSDRGVK